MSFPQVQEFHRFREEQRRLARLAAERRAAVNGWHNTSDADLRASVPQPVAAAETRTENVTSTGAPQRSSGIDDTGASIGVTDGAVREEIADSAATPATGGPAAAETRTENVASTGAPQRSSGIDDTGASIGVTDGAVREEIADSAATPATGGSGNVTRITIRGNPTGQSISIIQNSGGGPSVLMAQNPGATHRTLRVPPRARQFSVPVGVGANIQIRGGASQQTQNNNPNNPNVIPRVPIPRLEAQVIPTSAHDLAAGTNENDDEQHDNYRCTICYEFFVDPSSCGKCSSRFCHACLLRVATTRSSSNSTSSKCPACRAVLTVDDIVRDDALREELKAANLQVLCSYRGCDQRLPSASMKEHEQSCDYMPMRCKNATMGCPWNGVRKDLAHHLSRHCALEQVAGFVEQYRQTRADHQAAIIALQRSQTMNTQLTEVNSGLMRRALPSPTNIFDVLNLVYTSSCTTSYFLFTSDIWRLFLVQQGAQESRAVVCNFLYMLPTVLNVTRTAVGGYRLLLTVNTEQDPQLWVGNMELGVLSITPFLLLLTAGLCFLLDGQSSMKWSTYKYFGIVGAQGAAGHVDFGVSAYQSRCDRMRRFRFCCCFPLGCVSLWQPAASHPLF
ncbi:Zinc carboxypeptidase [Fragilaria crotonensis]|nr:Zinc carboxypeptidase [Fragilaria crotonensis]